MKIRLCLKNPCNPGHLPDINLSHCPDPSLPNPLLICTLLSTPKMSFITWVIQWFMTILVQ